MRIQQQRNRVKRLREELGRTAATPEPPYLQEWRQKDGKTTFLNHYGGGGTFAVTVASGEVDATGPRCT
jgi:hypothetical protein